MKFDYIEYMPEGLNSVVDPICQWGIIGDIINLYNIATNQELFTLINEAGPTVTIRSREEIIAVLNTDILESVELLYIDEIMSGETVSLKLMRMTGQQYKALPEFEGF